MRKASPEKHVYEAHETLQLLGRLDVLIGKLSHDPEDWPVKSMVYQFAKHEQATAIKKLVTALERCVRRRSLRGLRPEILAWLRGDEPAPCVISTDDRDRLRLLVSGVLPEPTLMDQFPEAFFFQPPKPKTPEPAR